MVRPELRRAGLTSARGCPGQLLESASLGQLARRPEGPCFARSLAPALDLALAPAPALALALALGGCRALTSQVALPRRRVDPAAVPALDVELRSERVPQAAPRGAAGRPKGPCVLHTAAVPALDVELRSELRREILRRLARPLGRRGLEPRGLAGVGRRQGERVEVARDILRAAATAAAAAADGDLCQRVRSNVAQVHFIERVVRVGPGTR
eukprot:scaffold30955_cov49-Phaeocystis_antarctica.AAC.1